jgi:hypothetical protein
MVLQRGSHMIQVKDTLSVPDHKQVAKGTLRSPIRSSGLTTDEFHRSWGEIAGPVERSGERDKPRARTSNIEG